MWGVPPSYKPNYMVDPNTGMILPVFYQYPQLNGNVIGKEVPIDKRMNNPFLNARGLKSLKDNLEVGNLLMINHRLTGIPYGPFTRQCPLDFDPSSEHFLMDMSFTSPAEYDRMLDDFIRRNSSRLVGVTINNIDDNIRQAFRMFLWVVTMRYRMTLGKTDYDYLWSPATTEEINEALSNAAYWAKCWADVENQWVAQCRMANTDQSNTFLKNMAVPNEANILRKTIMVAWRDNILKEQNQRPKGQGVILI